MSFKTILTCVESTESAENLISVSAVLAEQFKAHLIGFYVTPPPPVYATAEIATPSMLINYHDQHHREMSDGLSKVFEEISAKTSLLAEWRNVEAFGSVPTTIAEHAHTVDLVTVSGAQADADNSRAVDRLSSIVSANRRPTFVVPAVSGNDTIGSHVLVGWDGGDESTRAVFDALPLLKRAGRVDVLRINPTGDERHHTFGTPSELVNTLARHGVTSNLSFSVCGVSEIADELLKTAFESGADLLVMGAYGHGRVHDFLTGSVTRKVLKESSIPVFMSH